MFDFLGVTDSIIPSEMKQWYAIPLYNLLTRPQTKNLTENRGNHGKQSIRTPTAVGGRVRSADFVRKCILYIQDSDPCTVSPDAISRGSIIMHIFSVSSRRSAESRQASTQIFVTAGKRNKIVYLPF